MKRPRLTEAAKKDLRKLRANIYVPPSGLTSRPKTRQRLKKAKLIEFQREDGVWRITNKGKKFVDFGFK
jgi:hypothetical protein